jgi:DNA-directed RNA polymerase specialized sigma24 family protein
MPDDYRTVITLSCIVGMSHAEIAEELGWLEPAVRKLLSRARARLARLLVESEEHG